MSKRRTSHYVVGAIAIIVSIILFIVPFVFLVLTALKTRQEAAALEFSWPEQLAFVENFQEVVAARDYMLITAFINSMILTVASVTIMVLLAAMVGYVLQRRPGPWTRFVDLIVLSGLIIPPAVVPTIWVLQSLGLFATLSGLVLVEVAFGLAFSVLLFRQFVAAVPRDLDEAATIDGAGPVRLFFQVIFPLMRSVVITVIVVQSVNVFNDFVHPLYFLPGDENATVQLTLYNFQSQFSTQWNLLFMNILLISIPPLLVFLFLNKKLVAGLTGGAVKG